jgi:ABC-2 type transport system permease protein
MGALSIAKKDLQILLKDRGSTIYLFLLPVLFILLFAGLGASAGSGSGTDSRVPLPVVNLDPEGEAARAFLTALGDSGNVLLQPYGEAEARSLLARAKIWYVLTIPAGFSADVAAGRQVTIGLKDHPDADHRVTDSLAREVSAIASKMALEGQVLASLQQLVDMQANLPEATRVALGDRAQAQARTQFQTSQTRPLVTVAQTKPQAVSEPQAGENRLDFVQASVPAYAVLFVFLAAQTTAKSIYEEKKAGSFRRLLASPLGHAELLAGKLLPNLAATLLQIALMFAVGLLVFPLLGWDRLVLGKDPLALVLVSLVIALCSTSLGIFISAIARTEAQVGGLSTAILWIAAVMGGSLVPSFMLPESVNAIGRLLPHYWANQAYLGLMARGQTLAGVTTPMLVLLAFSVGFLAIGLRRFKFE